MKKRAVCVLSGGMDSTLCATLALKEGYEIIALHFDYSQRTQNRERQAFNDVCDALGISERVVLDVSFIATIGGSALTDSAIDVPKDGLGEAVPITYVPYRNGIFLSIAAALAEKSCASAIFLGAVEEDSSGYPDCRVEFIKAAQNAINSGIATDIKIEIKTPIIGLSKAEIVAKSIEVGSPVHLSWSCYDSEDEACGECDSCRLRLRGFELAKEVDKIAYKKR
ncbi:7-cyano-7-deazaguanine synthase QueC [Campylobacter sp. 19-13652]|uniref:7-cyano-7-deazaguanine synthase QueC n=1 Tax=Campylobacter sp. 19-13652 TaxID=2840180 RepID=UPI001C75A43E|nr:7-cyano-7-deazaguanine synthase QueC [Campylobacter sp. 19-13652]BCX79077.1 7-cyano-7-deazaguanine synthase [Campylobacter sp. 19-13652]